MKNYLIILLSILFSNTNAQITKDHTYLSFPAVDVEFPEISMVYETLPSESKVQKYATIDGKRQEYEGNTGRINEALVTIYNLDHSIYKEILVLPPSGYLEGETVVHKVTRYNLTEKPLDCDSVWVQRIQDEDTLWSCSQSIEERNSVTTQSGVAYSTHLFNNDEKIEFIVCWTKKEPYINAQGYYRENETDTLLLYNEDGEILYNFGSPYNNDESPINHQFKSTEEGFIYIIPRRYENQLGWDYYTLGGGDLNETSETIGTRSKSIQNFPAYPNPTSNTITIPYNIQRGEKVEIKIYNPNGQLQTSKIIDSSFKSLNLDVSSYPKGIYIYKYKNISDSFIVK